MLAESPRSLLTIDYPLRLMGGFRPIVAALPAPTKFTRLGTYLVVARLLRIAATLVASGHRGPAIGELVMAIPAHTLDRLAALRHGRWPPFGRSTPLSDAMPHVL